MTFRNRLQYLLVVRLQISNKEALNLIFSEKILVNGITAKSNCELTQTDEVIYDGKVLQEAKKLIYIAVDLTPILPGGENGGAKIFVEFFLKV